MKENRLGNSHNWLMVSVQFTWQERGKWAWRRIAQSSPMCRAVGVLNSGSEPCSLSRLLVIRGCLTTILLQQLGPVIAKWCIMSCWSELLLSSCNTQRPFSLGVFIILPTNQDSTENVKDAFGKILYSN